MTIKETLFFGVENLKKANINEEMLKARRLLAFVLGTNKEYLLIHNDDEISKEQINEYKRYINRLKKGEPLQYITNSQEFMGLNFFVNKSVLIPQPDTEILTIEVIELTKTNNVSTILDLCTGSGAIGISLSKNLPRVKVLASDISKKALLVADRNNRNLGTNVEFIKSNLFEKIVGNFDIIVSNPPYIEKNVILTLDKEVQKEPKLALNGGKDGLDFYRKIIGQAYKYLTPNGFLCLEIGYNQKEQVIDLINKTNRYQDVYNKKDLSNNDRIIICRKKE